MHCKNDNMYALSIFVLGGYFANGSNELNQQQN